MRWTRSEQAISIYAPLKSFIARGLGLRWDRSIISVSISPKVQREKTPKVHEGHGPNLHVSSIHHCDTYEIRGTSVSKWRSCPNPQFFFSTRNKYIFGQVTASADFIGRLLHSLPLVFVCFIWNMSIINRQSVLQPFYQAQIDRISWLGDCHCYVDLCWRYSTSWQFNF